MKMKELYEAVKSLPLDKVVEEYIHLSRSGANFTALCPFHDDHKKGNFIVNASRGMWKCFACGESGDAINFVSRICGVSLKEAAIRIAEDNGIISAADAENLRNGKKEEGVKLIQPRRIVRQEPNQKRDPEHLNLVYGAFARAADDLTPAHRDHLINTRQVGEYMDDFFEWPKDTPEFWERFDFELKAAGCKTSLAAAVSRVPGFSFNLEEMRPVFGVRRSGISIIQRDWAGRISGLQVRLDEAGDGCRYKLFSSSYAEFNDNWPSVEGASCGTISDIVWPKNNITGYAVTEGHFKAIQLAKLGYVVLSLNGVTNWRGVLGEFINVVKEEREDEPIHIFFDGDILTNPGVAKAGVGLCEAITGNGCPVYFVTWPLESGKGIDDVILAGNKSSCRRKTSEDFLKCIQTA